MRLLISIVLGSILWRVMLSKPQNLTPGFEMVATAVPSTPLPKVYLNIKSIVMQSIMMSVWSLISTYIRMPSWQFKITTNFQVYTYITCMLFNIVVCHTYKDSIETLICGSLVRIKLGPSTVTSNLGRTNFSIVNVLSLDSP